MVLKTGWPVQEVNEVGKLLVSRQSDVALYQKSAGGRMRQGYCEWKLIKLFVWSDVFPLNEQLYKTRFHID